MGTEFATFSIAKDVDLVAAGPAKDKFVDSLTQVLKEPGCSRVYWSVQQEDPTKIWLFFDWDSAEDYQRFGTSEHHGAWVAQFQGLLDFSAAPVVKFAELKPRPSASFLDGTIETIFFHFPADITAATRETVDATLVEFVEKGLSTSADFRGAHTGWVTQTDVPIPIATGADGQGSALLVFLGWPSVEAHMKFRETDAFKNTIGLIRGLPEMKTMGMFHLQCESRSRA
jgi:quinol monooxygenase YgiN